MSVSPLQAFDWIKEQSQSPELREIIALVKSYIGYTQERSRRVIQVSLRSFLE